MCGRFFIDLDYEALLERYGIGTRMVPMTYYSGEIKPSERVLYSNGSKMDFLTWGHKPSFSKKLLINARSETINEKPYYKNHKPLIVYASEYYEWHNITKAKYRFTSENHLLPMAAVELYHDHSSYLVLLTKSADKNIEQIHHRMPVILSYEQQEDWIRNGVINYKELLSVTAKNAENEQMTFL